jgi:hypothetical protein
MQLKLFANSGIAKELARTEHGGDSRRGLRKLERPVSTRRPIHVTLHSTRARVSWSLLRHRREVREALLRCARRSDIKVYDFANVRSHLHLLVRARQRPTISGVFAIVLGNRGARGHRRSKRSASVRRRFLERAGLVKSHHLGARIQGHPALHLSQSNRGRPWPSRPSCARKRSGAVARKSRTHPGDGRARLLAGQRAVFRVEHRCSDAHISSSRRAVQLLRAEPDASDRNSGYSRVGAFALAGGAAALR